MTSHQRLSLFALTAAVLEAYIWLVRDRVDAPVGSAPPIGTSGSHSDTTPAKSGLYWFSVLDFLQTTAGKDGTIETKALDVP